MMENKSTNGDGKFYRNWEGIYRDTLKEFIEGEIQFISDIDSKEIDDEIEIFFEFKGGGEEMLHIIDSLYKEITRDINIPYTLRNNFGIELDGDKKCFRAIFRIPKEIENFEELKKKSNEILVKIKDKLLEESE